MTDVVSSSQPAPVHGKRIDVFLLLLLIASLSLNVYLGWRVRQASPPSTNPQNLVKLLPGTNVNPVTAVGLDGKQHTISYGDTDKPTVFYILSPSCIWCVRNQSNIDQLARLKGNEFRFIGLSLAEPGLKDYVEGHQLNFPMYARLTSETSRSLGLGGTPQTIVISPDGRVLKNWTGAYIEHLRPEVEAYFGIRLPGLTSGNQ
jgi:hypothetical protein